MYLKTSYSVSRDKRPPIRRRCNRTKRRKRNDWNPFVHSLDNLWNDHERESLCQKAGLARQEIGRKSGKNVKLNVWSTAKRGIQRSLLLQGLCSTRGKEYEEGWPPWTVRTFPFPRRKERTKKEKWWKAPMDKGERLGQGMKRGWWRMRRDEEWAAGGSRKRKKQRDRQISSLPWHDLISARRRPLRPLAARLQLLLNLRWLLLPLPNRRARASL